MATYIPTNNPTATYGENSPSVLALQQQLNQQNAGQPGWTPLVEDSKYGPLTQAATTWQPVANPGIVSSTQARTDLTQGSTELDRITNTPDPYLEYWQMKANDLMYNPSEPGVEEQNLARQGAREIEKTQSDFAAYKAGLETLGIQTGLSQYAPGLQADKMIQATNAETSKIFEIQDKENLAIAKAKQARLDNDADMLKEALDEIRQIKSDKAEELQRIANKRVQDITVADSLATFAYKELKSLPADQQEAFLLQLASDNDISLLALQGALAREQDNQLKLADSLSDGSDSGNPGDYTDQELKKLRAAGIDPSDIEIADNYLYQKGLAPSEYNQEYFEDTYSTDELWNLALSLGVPRSKDLTRQPEINQFFSDSDLLSYTQAMLASGYSVEDIISKNE